METWRKIGEGLSYSDYYSEDIPYEVKPVPCVSPMEEADEIRFPNSGPDKTYYYTGAESVGPFVYFNNSGIIVMSNLRDSKLYSNNPQFQDFLRKYDRPSLRMHLQTHGMLKAMIRNAIKGGIDAKDPQAKTFSNLLYSPPNFITRGQTFDGRLFDGSNGVYLAMWPNRRDIPDSDLKKILWVVSNSGYDPEKIMYVFGGSSSKHSTYEEVMAGKKIKSTPKAQLALMRLMHLNADVKKNLLQNSPVNKLQNIADQLGISLVQLRQTLEKEPIAEAEDVIFDYDYVNYQWDGDEAKAVIVVYNGGEVAVWSDLNEHRIHSNIPEIDKTLSSILYCSNSINAHEDIEAIVIDYIKDLDKNDPFFKKVLEWFDFKSIGVDYQDGPLFDEGSPTYNSRFFDGEAGAFLGFWPNRNKIPPKAFKLTLQIIQEMGYNPKQIMYTFGNNGKAHYNFDQASEGKEIKKTDKKQLDLMKLMHLDAQAKKRVLKDYPVNKLQSLADKSGISLVQLQRSLEKEPIAEKTFMKREELKSLIKECIREIYGWEQPSPDQIDEPAASLDDVRYTPSDLGVGAVNWDSKKVMQPTSEEKKTLDKIGFGGEDNDTHWSKGEANIAIENNNGKPIYIWWVEIDNHNYGKKFNSMDELLDFDDEYGKGVIYQLISQRDY